MWGMAKQKLKFYDIKAKQAFETDKYEIIEKDTARGKMKFAVATSPYTGIKVYRLLGKA
ncbi:paREP4 [Pyrobaculum calidifontis JCM 11548]|uniref:PaREP4 n=2 Tax=Pyrobaculum calidifontis TaxID=181486 RepID=A3MVL4_PYRCJ|nr:paREP4 [Pyrobaculum calidifontis JCM 11548]